MRALGPLRIQLINDDCVGNECSDIEASKERLPEPLMAPEEERYPPVKS